jgi:hypothetical protein
MIDELNNIKKDIQEYLELNLEIIKLTVAESISRFFSTLIKVVMVIFFASIILLFLSIAAAFWLGDMLNSPVAGFLIIAGFNLLLLLIFILTARYSIDKPVIRSVISLFFPKDSK